MEDNLKYTSSLESGAAYVGVIAPKYNPFALLLPAILERMITKEYRFFVLQAYEGEGFTGPGEIFLVSHYKDKETAVQHFQAWPGDCRRALYDVQVPADRETLYVLADQPAEKTVYINLFKEKKWRQPFNTETLIKKYLKLNNLPPIRRSEAVVFGVHFGVINVDIPTSKGRIIVPMRDLENVEDVNQWKTLPPGVSDGELPF